VKCRGCVGTTVDWLRCEVKIERGVVEGHTDDNVKTQSSRKWLPLDQGVISALRTGKLQIQFSGDDDYVFASPFMLGKKHCEATTSRLMF
jgi:hypothetical protein